MLFTPNLGTRWKSMVALLSNKTKNGIDGIGGWVGLTSGLDVVKKREICYGSVDWNTFRPTRLSFGSKFTFGRYQVQAPAGLHVLAQFIRKPSARPFPRYSSYLHILHSLLSSNMVRKWLAQFFAARGTWVIFWHSYCLLWLNLFVVVLSPGK